MIETKVSSINTVLLTLNKDGEIWFWEVSTTQFKAEEAYGSAIERNRNVVLPWRLLKKAELTEEMLDYCKAYMNQ